MSNAIPETVMLGGQECHVYKGSGFVVGYDRVLSPLEVEALYDRDSGLWLKRGQQWKRWAIVRPFCKLYYHIMRFLNA